MPRGKVELGEWAGTSGDVAREVELQSARCLATYEKDRLRVEQDAAIETGIAQGGYGRKQLYELIQNGADALLGSSGNIEVVLTRDCLYVANEGRPMSVDGVSALMASHLSRKRGDEIGRFGLGFKSVIAISDGPQVLSRSGSFCVRSRSQAKQALWSRAGRPFLPNHARGQRRSNASPAAERGSRTRELMDWATTVIRIPLKDGQGGAQGGSLVIPSARSSCSRLMPRS